MLLRKIKDYDEFEFTKILQNGYKIDEKEDIIYKTKFVNGRRKKIITDYKDCIIELNIGCWDLETLQTYLQELTDGTYEYYSIIDGEYKKANFIVTVPPQIIENAIENGYIVSDISIVLEKSSELVI